MMFCNPLSARYRFLPVLCLLALATGAFPLRAQPAAPAAAPEGGLPLEKLMEMEKEEEVTETFVNTLHDLAAALMKGDRQAAAAAFFADTVQGRPFPSRAAKPVRELKWLSRRSWELPGNGASPLPRADLLASLDRFLGHFGTPERVFFDVVSSSVNSAGELQARIALSILARNVEGKREWVRGKGSVSARRGGDGAWRISELALDEVESLIAERDLFNNVAEAAGIAASDLPLAEAMKVRKQWYPNGAAANDVDRDGLLDLFVTGPDVNSLYLSRGDGTFRDTAAVSGLKTLLPDSAELNPVFLDYDNDGDSDLFITSVHQNLLLENRLVPDGRVSFRDASAGLPQFPDYQGWSVAPGDVNRDGYPDLYVTSYLSPFKGPSPVTTVDDVNGKPNILLINQRDGTFKEEGQAWGVADSRFGMAAQLADVDGDHDLDLYVANDFGGGNPLYINEGDRFVDRSREHGAALHSESMGVSFADFDNDGDLDLHVTNMSSVAASRILSRFEGSPLRRREHLENQWSGNSLLENVGGGKFRDRSAEAGPFLADWAWGGGFIDIDNDGWEDLHTPNGFLSGQKPYDLRSMIFGRAITSLQRDDPEEVRKLMMEVLMKMGGMTSGKGFSMGGWAVDRVYLSRGNGRFLDISGVAGADSGVSDARSSVYADFDNDGDLDIFLRAAHGTAHFLFRNEVGQDNAFLRVGLEGRASGRDAFGTVVRVKTPAMTLTKSKHGNNGYLDQSDPRLLFGLGEGKAVEWIEVRWPSGLVQKFAGPFEGGASLYIVEGEEKPRPVKEKRFRLPDPKAGS